MLFYRGVVIDWHAAVWVELFVEPLFQLKNPLEALKGLFLRVVKFKVRLEAANV